MPQSESDNLGDALGRVAGTSWRAGSGRKDSIREAVVDRHHRLCSQGPWHARRLLVVVVAVAAVSGTSVAGILTLNRLTKESHEKQAMERPMTEETASSLELLREHDSFAVIEALADPSKDPLEIVKAYAELVHDLYWKNKDIQGVVAFGRAGIQFGLESAIEIEQRDPEHALKIRRAVKMLTYNLASFTWPGWNQDGVVIGDFERDIGFDAAKANLRLTHKVRKGDRGLSNAHWMLGAHHLAARQFDDARRTFARSRDLATRAGSETGALLSTGFIHVTDLIVDPSNAAATTKLSEVKARLLPLKDGEFLSPQFDDALTVFQRRE